MGNKRWLANALIGLGAILILVVIGYFGWSQVSAARLRAELRAAPVEALPAVQVAAAASTTESLTAAGPTQGPASPTGLPPTEPVVAAPVAPAASPTASATRPAATVTRAPTMTAAPATVAPATARPTNTATRRPTPRPTATVPPAPTAAAVAERAGPIRMALPDLKIDAKVVPMTWQVVNTAQGPRSEWVIPKDEAGHHINSAYLGEAGNLVISGHNNIYGRVLLNISQAWDNATRVAVDDFTDRSEILQGRRLTLYDAAGNAREYMITDFYRVRDTGVSQEQRIANGRFMLPTETEQVTVITCWPPTNNTHRLVVIAKPVQ